MKILTIILMCFIQTTAIAFTIKTIEQDQNGVTLIEQSPNTNYSSNFFPPFVGTNLHGFHFKSIFGFDLSDFDVNPDRIKSVGFTVHGFTQYPDAGHPSVDAGYLSLSLGLDNSWDRNTVTYASHGNLHGEIQSVIYFGLGSHGPTGWKIDNDSFKEALSEKYLTVYLDEYGTNFHNLPGFHRILDTESLSGDFEPRLSIAVPEPPTLYLVLTMCLLLAGSKVKKFVRYLSTDKDVKLESMRTKPV